MTRAPFDDWRRGGEGGGQGEAGQQQAGESGEGWRTSGRRWGGKCLEIDDFVSLRYHITCLLSDVNMLFVVSSDSLTRALFDVLQCTPIFHSSL